MTGPRHHPDPPRAAGRGSTITPHDAPFVAVPGVNPDRILVLGDTAAVAAGVERHSDALAGRLAHAVSARTGRGVVVDQEARPGFLAADLPQAAMGLRLDRYDAIVVVPGSADTESRVPTATWTASLAALIERVRDVSLEAFVVLSGAGRPAGGGEGRASWRPSLGALRIRSMDRAAAALAARTLHAGYVSVPGPTSGPAADRYERWAAELSGVLAPALADAAGHDGPDPEDERVDALARTGLAGPRRDDGFQELAVTAKRLLNADIAAVTFLDADSQWFHAMEGAEYESIPRSLSLCNATLGSAEPVVYGDMHLERQLDSHPLVHGEPPIRFYAGCAVESPDGYRIGTVCVFGTEPRNIEDVDVSALQRLAAEVRERVWARSGEQGGPAAPTTA